MLDRQLLRLPTVVLLYLLGACGGTPAGGDAAPDAPVPVRDGGASDAASDVPAVKPDAAPAPVERYGWCFPGQRPCRAGLKCLRSMCQVPCDEKKGESGNPDCPDANDLCFKLAGDAWAHCKRRCDALQGAEGNPDCPSGTHCASTKIAPTGKCTGTFSPPRPGTLGLGAPCKDGYTAAEQCDGLKGLFCPLAREAQRCMKACDLRRGKQANPDCPATAECIELHEGALSNATSFLGGVCLPPPSQGLDQPCAPLAQRCKAGFLCSEAFCRATCDSTKGAIGNPACDALGTGFACKAAVSGDTCALRCDPKVGVVKGTTCPTGSFCQASASPSPGLCQRLPATPPAGPLALGARCDPSVPTLQCQAALACVEEICQPICDPAAASSRCAANETCVERVSVPSGGLCVRAPSSKLGETCNQTSARCVTGLVCGGGRCQTACDATKGTLNNPDGPAQATQACSDYLTVRACLTLCDPKEGGLANPRCPVGTRCATSSQAGGGVCSPYARRPGLVASVGAPCDAQGSLSTRCDPELGLSCLWSGQCVRACDPRTWKASDPPCTGAERCEEDSFSFTQGVCLAPGSATVGQRCENGVRCATGLICVTGVCATPCDKAAGVENNPACPGQVCVSEWNYSAGQYSSLCRRICDDTQGLYDNPSCPVGTRCESTSGLPAGLRALCKAVSGPDLGSLGFGASCSFATADAPSVKCDSTKGLACVDDYCHKACDPHRQNQDCEAGQTCYGTHWSFLGGYCL
ncbi:MAG: hypothetical protein IT371_16805 [Deltaproteobacteria bacterium]|nr:hypothetical protein [Deltaproteobacteria bacterium]